SMDCICGRPPLQQSGTLDVLALRARRPWPEASPTRCALGWKRNSGTCTPELGGGAGSYAVASSVPVACSSAFQSLYRALASHPISDARICLSDAVRSAYRNNQHTGPRGRKRQSSPLSTAGERNLVVLALEFHPRRQPQVGLGLLGRHAVG